MDYTTVGLLASIRRRASIPTTATTGGANADLLAYANEEIRLRLCAQILSVREEHLVRSSDVTLTSAPSYRIPHRALGGKLRRVSLVDANGNEVELPRLEPERLEDFTSTGQLFGYYLRSAYVVLVPSASSTFTTLRLSYHCRPNELVASGFGIISAINTTTGVLTVDSSTGITTSTPVDLVKATSPFESMSIDLTPTAVADGTHVTILAASLPSDLAVNDYVCLAQQSPVPQLPAEYHPILAQRSAVKYLEAQGAEELATAQGVLEQMEASVLDLITPRVDAGCQKIINRHGALGGSWRYRLRGV